jgi:hypothetical protein
MGLGVPATVWAERPENTLPRFEVTSFGGYRIGGEFDLEDDQGAPLDDAELDESFSWGLGLGVYRDAFGYYELLYARQSTEFDSRIPDVGDVDITTEYYQFGGTLLFDYEPWLLPYLSLTIGLTRFDADGFGSEWEFSGTLGFGARVPVSNRLSLMFGVRGYATLIESDSELFCVSSGGATCVVRTSGDVVYQGEALAGLAFRF